MQNQLPEDHIDKQLELEVKLFEYDGDDAVLPISKIKELLRKKDPFRFKIDHSGFPTLDELTKGFRGGELVIISGPTKHGKTTFMQTLTYNFWRQGIHSLWFSYEMAPDEMIERFEGIEKAVELYMPYPLLRRGSAWFFNRMLEAKVKHECRAVFIDHLHYLVDFEKSRNASLDFGKVIRDIKIIAQRLNIVIFLACHLTKVKFDQEPTEADIRDSSFMAQEADCTFMIWRKPGEEDFNRISVRNHRRTGVIGKSFVVKHSNRRLTEPSEYEKNI